MVRWRTSASRTPSFLPERPVTTFTTRLHHREETQVSASSLLPFEERPTGGNIIVQQKRRHLVPGVPTTRGDGNRTTSATRAFLRLF